MPMVLYGVADQVTFKAFLTSHSPARGMIRVVIAKHSAQLFADKPLGRAAFFCSDPTVSEATIIEAVADRSAIEELS